MKIPRAWVQDRALARFLRLAGHRSHSRRGISQRIFPLKEITGNCNQHWKFDGGRHRENSAGIVARGTPSRGREAMPPFLLVDIAEFLQRGAGGMPQSDEVAIYRTRLQHLAELGVGANRFASGKILSRHGIEWFVLDDGFQHMQLARDVDIVLLDATDPFAEGWMIPAGLLREPKSALARADIIIVTRSPKTPAIETIVQRITHVPIFHAVTELLDVVRIPTHPSQPPEPLAELAAERKLLHFVA